MSDALPRILITIGDVNGIGPELLFKTLRRSNLTERCSLEVIGNARLLAEWSERLRLNDVHVEESAIRVGAAEAPLHSIESDASLAPGTIDPQAGMLAGDAISWGVERLVSGRADGLLTLPISKKALNLGGYDWPGHTEMIAHLSGGGNPMMILLTEGMRVALATIHIPLRAVPDALSSDLIAERLAVLHNCLITDFGISSPRIAVLGLNPHAGENGSIGDEEETMIEPILAALQEEGLDISGPFPADAFFARYSPGDYDGILAMYHDQGLIPLKMFARGAGVNMTAGLSIVRTSPDHGTAFDIAGEGIADERSTIEALQCAVGIVLNRRNAS